MISLQPIVCWLWELKADSNVVGCVAQCSPYKLLYIGCVWVCGLEADSNVVGCVAQ